MKWRVLELLKIIVRAVVDTIGLLKAKKVKPNQKQQMTINFAPDEIVSSEIFRGRFFICTRHILWEVEENSDGFTQIKLIKHT